MPASLGKSGLERNENLPNSWFELMVKLSLYQQPGLSSSALRKVDHVTGFLYVVNVITF
jgi:hypothetical protein